MIFPSVIAGVGGDDFTDLATLESQIQTAKAELLNRLAGGANAVYDVLSQTKCETNNVASQDFLQVYFAIMFEAFVP